MFYFVIRMRHVASGKRIVVMTDECRNEIFARLGAEHRYPEFVAVEAIPATRADYERFLKVANLHPETQPSV